MTTNHWIRRLILVTLGGIGLAVGTLIAIRLYAASFDFIYPRTKQITVSRTVQPQNFWTIGSGGRITVTIMVTNSEAVALRGFYYSDQVPTGWTVNTVQVQVNGSSVTNYSYATGTAGEIYSGNTPRRWELELPQGDGVFSPTRPIPASGGTARLVYTMLVNSGTGDDYELGREGWAGWLASNPGVAVFGYQGITQTLQADFSATPRSGTAPLTVQFTNLSTGSPSEWRWDLGDSSTSTAQHPSHSYALPKTYTVTLTVTRTATGEPSTVVKRNYITVTYPALQANFTASPQSGTGPLNVQFTDHSTGTVVSRLWQFGDGGTSTQLSPAHSYNAVGFYTVTLTITDAYRSNKLTRPRYITVTYPPLQADFTALPRFGLPSLDVQFTDQSVGTVTSRRWNFGDGSTSTQASPSHTYDMLGYYTVTLTITDTYRSHATTRPQYIHVTDTVYWVYLPVVLRNY